MIRKAIIVVLTLGAVGIGVAWLDSYLKHQVDANHRGGCVVRKVGDICGLISWRHGWISVKRIENCNPLRQNYFKNHLPSYWYAILRGKIIHYDKHVTVDGSRAFHFAIRAWVLGVV